MSEKNKTEEIKNDGIEKLLKIGTKEISKKTFIHKEELENFLNGNFKTINQTKAHGFIQILQREFNVDLSDLKEKYNTYMHENTKPKKSAQPLIVEEIENEKSKKRWFSILFILLGIALVVYLLNKNKLLNFEQINKVEIATTPISTEIKDAQNNLELLNKNQSVSIVEKTINNVAKDKNTTLTPSTVETIIQQDSPDNLEAINATTKENINLQEPSSEIQDDIAAIIDEKPTTLVDLNNTTTPDIDQLNKTIKEPSVDFKETLLAPNNSEISEITPKEIYIIPKSKIWIGTIDLTTFKKKDFLSTKGVKIDIDVTKNQLIMLGHNFLNMYKDSEKLKFKAKGPIRFSYIDGVLKEITRKEFNALSKGKQW